MAVTFESFITRFPEFARNPDDLSGAFQGWIEAHIAAAVIETPSSVWGAMQDEGVYYLAAHKLAISPFGIAAKLGSKNGESVYGVERKRLNCVVASGGRVTGWSETDLSNAVSGLYRL